MLIAYPLNARDDKQRKECEEANRKGECPFCFPSGSALNDPDDPVILLTDNWAVKQNKFPLKGAKVHLVIIPIDGHITELGQLSPEAILDLHQEVLPWILEKFPVPGFTLYVRQNPEVTGGTLYHLHLQLICPAEGETVNVAIGPRR